MSNLAVHYIRTHGRQSDHDLIGAVSNRLVKLVYSGMPNHDALKQVKEKIDADAYIILRNHPLSEQKDDVVRDPEEAGRRHAREWANWLNTAPYLDRKRTFVEGVNEFPLWVHGNEVYARYLVAHMDALDEYGIRGCVGHFNVGWPANSGDDTPSDWSPYDSVLARLSWEGHWLGLHEYFGLTGPRQRMTGWWAYRYRHCIDYCRANGLPFPPIVITELGICQDFQHPNGDWALDPVAGYKGALDPAAAFAFLVQYAQDAEADGIIAGTVFTTDGGHPWIESMDTEPLHPYWMRLGRQTLGRPPAQPKPATRPSTPPSRPQVPDVSQPTDAGPVTHLRDIAWPPVQGTITQGFGRNPENYARFHMPGHDGVDFGAPLGKPVHAVADGEIAWVDWDDNYGNYIRIWHPQYKVHSFYAHLSEQLVTQGEKVAAGDLIGKVGSTGNSTGPHLHLEIRLAEADGSYIEGRASGYGHGRVDPTTWYEIAKRM